jgi:methylenetetrahydrofolate--tRNA-(uracil-5-)-methyltransferase
MQAITVVGAGLAGTECALQLASLGHHVELFEMRPQVMTAAHKTGNFGELVCSNSFGSQGAQSAPGLLKWEARQWGCFVLQAAEKYAVPAGQALALDRELFAQQLTEWVHQHPRIKVMPHRVTSLEDIPRPAVIATGPLTDEALAESMRRHFEQPEFLYFFDAIAPIIDADSIDLDIAWRADRYDKGTPDYLNCPLEKDHYLRLIEAITQARKIEPKDFEKTEFFEGCMPIETMVARGPQTLRFGPMKPVGLTDPRTGRRPYAVVQLRAENRDQTSYNMVGFQTRMAYGEQTRVFRMIPGLENAEFLKLGSIHRNLYLNSPLLLNADLSSRRDPWLLFAGQITGVEGYFESTCMGLLVAHFLDQKLKQQEATSLPRETAMGALLTAITDPERAKHFQPTNINWGLFPPLTDYQGRDKAEKRQRMIDRAQKLARSGETSPPA